MTGTSWRAVVPVGLINKSVVYFHAVTVLNEAVAYLSAMNGYVIKTGTVR